MNPFEPTDRVVNLEITTQRRSECVKYIKKYIVFFRRITFVEPELEALPPSELARTILLCSRRALKFRPMWNMRLAMLTNKKYNPEGGGFHEFKGYEKIWKLFHLK